MQTDGFSEPALEIHQQISLKDKLLKKGFWLYLISFIIAPTGYIIKVLISRSMSPGDVGLIYSIIGFISILATYNDLGLTDSLQYFLPQYFIDKEYGKAKSMLVFTWILQFITGIIIGCILLVAAPWLALHYFDSPDSLILLRIFAIYFLIINLFQVIQSVFYATQSVKYASGIDAVRLWSVAIFVLGYWYFDILTMYHFALAWLFGLIIGTIVGIIWGIQHLGRLRNHKTELDWGIAKTWLGYGFRILLGANVSTILGQIDQQFALLYFGKQSAGYRTNYLSLTAILSIVTVPLSNYFLPLFTELTKKAEYGQLKNLFVMAYGRFGLVSILIGGFAYFLGPWIATLLFGDMFVYTGELYRFSAPFMCIGLFMSINFQYLAGIGLVKLRVKLVIVGIIITLIANFALAPILGLKALIAGNTIGRFVLWARTSLIIFNRSTFKHFFTKKHD